MICTKKEFRKWIKLKRPTEYLFEKELTMSLLQSEINMWADSEKELSGPFSDEYINEKYNRRDYRIVTEANREALPNFVEALKRPDWMLIRPFYQRRRRWERDRQSKLIESFIMNIPVPPLFIFESDFAKYEVMDGQQRVTAIQDFYADQFELESLEHWQELNGKRYSQLPSEIKKGIDRRSISYIVLLKESAATVEEQLALRQMVFERLNTGGIKLSHQEIRNCLYHGLFNIMLTEIVKENMFRECWGLPLYSKTEDVSPSDELLNNTFYSDMSDIEVVLRFFTLRNIDNYRYGMQGFLSLYMAKASKLQDKDLCQLKQLFLETLLTAKSIFGENVFRPFDKEKSVWAKKPHVAFSDAVMIGLANHRESKDILISKKNAVVENTKKLFVDSEEGTFTGRGNSKRDVSNRIKIFTEMLGGIVSNV